MSATTTAKTPKTTAPKRTTKTPAARMTLAETMRELEQAGSEQTRKTYARHGATGPMFGVSFATLKGLLKRIGVDHELACALWETDNLDARNLAVKIVDPARLTAAELDKWARESSVPKLCGGYVAMLAATAAAQRIGKVHIDYGDTACKTPDAASYIEKAWAHSVSKGFASPAAHERTREFPRLRC